jgi:hypothetical protein
MSIMHLGTVLVKGRRRVPKPAAIIRAFIITIIKVQGAKNKAQLFFYRVSDML